VADENALKALIPENLTDPSQLPSFLPSTIRVIPEIKRDDEVLMSAGAMALGEEIDMGYNFRTPTQNYLNKRDSVVVGSYLALGIVGSNPSKKTFEKLKANLEQTKLILESGTESQKAALTREKLIGDMFITGIQGYYTRYITQSKAISQKSRTMYQPIPMAGTFGYEPYQRTFLGLNRGIESHGMYMNVRTAQAIKDRSGDNGKAKQLMSQVGMLGSALEHQVPEQIFTDPDSVIKPNGFSTAKALGMAMVQGQKIYIINQQNQAQALPNLRLDGLAMDEIRSALASGKEIIAHTNQLSVSGFRGSGYATTDPVTGEGVYKISGGKNGGYCDLPVGVCPKNSHDIACALAGFGLSLLLGGAVGGLLAALFLPGVGAAYLIVSMMFFMTAGTFFIMAAGAIVEKDFDKCHMYLTFAISFLMIGGGLVFGQAGLSQGLHAAIAVGEGLSVVGLYSLPDAICVGE
jgi:hypothetical protein